LPGRCTANSCQSPSTPPTCRRVARPVKLFIAGAARHHARRHGTGVELGHDGGLLG
jgi:hypothetical protein